MQEKKPYVCMSSDEHFGARYRKNQISKLIKKQIDEITMQEKTLEEELTVFKINRQKENGYRLTHEDYLEFIQAREKKVVEEERQFILNILDGIDIADKEMGVVGGTKAIRLALQSRTTL